MAKSYEPTMTGAEIENFNGYLANCTDDQVRGVYEKELAAGRSPEVALCRAEARRRNIYLTG